MNTNAYIYKNESAQKNYKVAITRNREVQNVLCMWISFVNQKVHDSHKIFINLFSHSVGS
jgi:hypothetical protein